MSHLNDAAADKLYMIFRNKMQEVYRKNYKPDPFGKSMTTEFNAWQDFLRNSLRLEVVDADSSPARGPIVDRKGSIIVEIPNPSNGASFGFEYIVVPGDLAEKALALGDLPDKL